MAIEQYKIESYSELGEVKRRFEDIGKKVELIEGKQDVHNLLEEIKECHELCYNSEDRKLKGPKIRDAMQSLVKEIMSRLHYFDQADAKEFKEASEKIIELKQRVGELIEEINNLLYSNPEEETGEEGLIKAA